MDPKKNGKADPGQSSAPAQDPPPAGGAEAPPSGEASAAPKLTPEEQMALYEKDLKETDWGHQPC